MLWKKESEVNVMIVLTRKGRVYLKKGNTNVRISVSGNCRQYLIIEVTQLSFS